MKKLLAISLITILIFSGKGMGQIFNPEVLCSGGHTYEEGSFSWYGTIGDVFTETLLDSECLISQGFHQPEKVTLSVKELSTASMYSIFPNPVMNWFTIHTPATNSPKLNSLRIFDLQGRAHWQQGDIVPGSQLQISGLPRGIYILEVRTEQKDQCRIKFIKQ